MFVDHGLDVVVEFPIDQRIDDRANLDVQRSEMTGFVVIPSQSRSSRTGREPTVADEKSSRPWSVGAIAP